MQAQRPSQPRGRNKPECPCPAPGAPHTPAMAQNPTSAPFWLSFLTALDVN